MTEKKMLGYSEVTMELRRILLELENLKAQSVDWAGGRARDALNDEIRWRDAEERERLNSALG